MSKADRVARLGKKVLRDAQDVYTPTDDSDPLAEYIELGIEAFAEQCIDPETGRSFVLYKAQRDFLRRGFSLTPDGRLPYPELVYSCPKKSGKTATAALAVIYVVRVLGGKFAEGYTVEYDFDQAQGRVFKAAARIIEATPMLQDQAKIRKNVIQFHNGSTIEALPSDHAGAAGSNPSIVSFDELWGYTTENARRLWDEMVPPPTRKVTTRLTVTYAGYDGESELLEELYKRGVAGDEVAPGLFESPGLLCAWHHEPVAPWQTDEWIEQMRLQLRTNAFLRLIQNHFVSGEGEFVDMLWWDECTHDDLSPIAADPELPVWVGVDGSVKRDLTALVAVTWDQDLKRVRLVNHKTFQPSPDDPLDFEATVEKTVLDWRDRYRVKRVYYDPYQLVASAQRLTNRRVRMEEFPQSLPNLTEMSSNLYDLIKGRNIAVYPDDEFRLAVSRCVAIENPRGWKISKKTRSHKIDLIIALGCHSSSIIVLGPSWML